MSTKGSPPKTANMAPPGGQFGSQQCCDDNSESPENGTRPATGKESRSVKHANQYQPPHGYGYPSSQQPFPGAPQFYHQSPFNMTHNRSQPTTSVGQRYPGYEPPWQGYYLHQGGYGKSQLFPQQQFQGQELTSQGALGVPPGLAGNNPVNRPTSSSSTSPPGPPSGAPGRPLISLPTKRFLPAAELLKTDVA
jgi:hypothetical protein